SEEAHPNEQSMKARADRCLASGSPWLVVDRGRRRKPRWENELLVSIDGNVLDRMTFLKAVAMTANGDHAEEKVVSFGGRPKGRMAQPSRAYALNQGRLILVAEDNETNEKVIVRQLALLGYAADMATNGREALKRWRSGNSALLLTDLHMPEMDGYALAEAIRREEAGAPALPIIALSANALKSEVARCTALGINSYLVKPASLASLQECMEQWMPPLITGT